MLPGMYSSEMSFKIDLVVKFDRYRMNRTTYQLNLIIII